MADLKDYQGNIVNPNVSVVPKITRGTPIADINGITIFAPQASLEVEVDVSVNSNQYTAYYFDAPIPAGSIIQSIKGASQPTAYLLRRNGTFNDTLISNLPFPYTTEEEYVGIQARGTYDLGIIYRDSNPSVESRVAVIEGKNPRRIIYIDKSTTDIQLVDIFYDAFVEGNCDLVFETGTYILKNAYPYMRDTLHWGWNEGFGLPIGNNCRYFFNGSTLIGDIPDGYGSSDSRNVLDSVPKKEPSNYEIHDVTLRMIGNKSTSGGVYCVHDEGYGKNTPYFHRYCNVTFYSDGASCLGSGSGYDTYLRLENCTFLSAVTFNMHGPTNNTDNRPVKMRIDIDSCYYKLGAPLRINQNTYDATRDDIIVRCCNCYAAIDIPTTTLSVITEALLSGNTFGT